MNTLVTLKRRVRQAVPPRVLRRVERWREERRLGAVPGTASLDVASLRAAAEVPSLPETLGSAPVGEFDSWAQKIAKLGISASAGGVNRGDQRALYHLIGRLRPWRVLEVGTHIGASTVFLAAALKDAHGGEPLVEPMLTTVDIADVNDSVSGAWRESGCSQAPRAMLETLELGDLVRFVVSPSLDYLRRTDQTFDLIFLDGDHAAATVYREVPAALGRLRPGGLLCLHDYYPGGRPLWQSGRVIWGPWLAIERLRAEGARLEAQPFGELPWASKDESRRSSLALLARP